MIESQGIREHVRAWRTHVVARMLSSWYIKNYGPQTNLFVDQKQTVQLECLRAGIQGTKTLWGHVLTYKG